MGQKQNPPGITLSWNLSHLRLRLDVLTTLTAHPSQSDACMRQQAIAHTLKPNSDKCVTSQEE